MMRQGNSRLLATSMLVGLHLPAYAYEIDSVISLGYEPGGDKILGVTFTNGDTASLRANEGINLSAGVLYYHSDDHAWQTQTTIGIKYMPIYAHNGRAEWTTYPVEVMGFYNTDLLRFGAGMVYQINPHVDTDGVVSAYSADLDDSVGLIAQVGFRPRKRKGFAVELRYTAIRYSGTVVVGGTPQRVDNLDGSSGGLWISTYF